MNCPHCGVQITDFYEFLDENIRPIVRLLRDNGFNTTCSCQGGKDHSFEKPTIELEYLGLVDGDIERIHSLLVDNDYDNFTIRVDWQCLNGCILRSMDVEFET